MKNRLYRSRVKRVFGGVAGGLAEYMNLDPILVRILFIITAAINGIGALLYIIMWIVVPEAPLEYEFPNYNKPESDPGKEGGTANSTSSDTPTSDIFMGADQNGKQVKSTNSRLIIGVILIGFGTFSVSHRDARTGRNPQTGETIQIAAKNVVKFKPGKEISEAVN